MEQTLIPDTHAFVREMTAAGMPQPVAEAFVSNYTKYLISNLATKHDIQESNQATTIAIEGLRKDTKTDITKVHHEIELLRKDTNTLVLETKIELTKTINASQFKIIGFLGGFTGLIFLLDKLF